MSYDIQSALGRMRGRRSQGLTRRTAGLIPHDDVCVAHWLTTRSDVPDLLESYRDQDFPDRRTKGGRPTRVNDTQLVVAALLAGMSGIGMHDKEMASILWDRLEPQSRELLCLPTEPTGTPAAYYVAVNRAWHRLCDLIDPKPGMGGTRRPRAEVEAFIAGLDQNVLDNKHERLMTVSNALLEATWQLVPKHVRDSWDGSIAIDGTPLRVWGKRGSDMYVTEKPEDLLSPEVHAGWYKREPDLRGTNKKSKDTFWAYELHAAVAFNRTDDTLPRLAMAMSFDRPAVNIAGNSFACLDSIRQRGHQAGTFVADRGVLPGGKVTNLHDKAKALGYDLCFDYKGDELGIQGNHAGATLVEGHWYGPCMPQHLISASIDYQKKHIDADTFKRRIGERAQYLVRDKQRPSDDGYTVKTCPAAGSSPTAQCPKKPNDNASKRIQLGLPVVRISDAQVPQHPDSICTNTASVTFAPSASGKFTQDIRYKTPEWSEVYARGRNYSEGFNAYAKDHTYEALEVPGRRRVRGFARQCILTAVLVACANYRKIITLATKTGTTTQTPTPHRQPMTRHRPATQHDNWTAPPRPPQPPALAATGMLER